MDDGLGPGTLILAVIASNALLRTVSRERGRTARRKSGLAHGIVPFALIGTWLAGLGIASPWLVLGLCLTGLGDAIWRLLSARERAERGVHAIAAQLFFSLSLLELSHQLHFDEHSRWALFAISLAMGQGTRLWLRRQGAGSPASAVGPAVAKVTIALLVLTPLAYFVIQGGADPGSFAGSSGDVGADRASLIAQYLCLLLVGFLTWRADLAVEVPDSSRGQAATRMQILVAGYALGWLIVIPSALLVLREGGWLPRPLWNQTIVVVLLLVVALLVLVFEALPPAHPARCRFARLMAGEEAAVRLGRPDSRGGDTPHLLARALVAATYLGLTLIISRGEWWHVRRVEPPAPGWGPLDRCGPAGGSSGLWGVRCDPGAAAVADRDRGAVARGGLQRKPVRPPAAVTTKPRSWSWLHGRLLSGGAILVLFNGGLEANAVRVRQGSLFLEPLVGSGDPATALAYIGTALIVVSAVAAVPELPRRHRERGGEAAALILAGAAQHAWHLANGHPGFFWMAQYWVLVLALLTVHEIRAARRRDVDYPVIASAVLLSASTPFAWVLDLGWGADLAVGGPCPAPGCRALAQSEAVHRLGCRRRRPDGLVVPARIHDPDAGGAGSGADRPGHLASAAAGEGQNRAIGRARCAREPIQGADS